MAAPWLAIDARAIRAFILHDPHGPVANVVLHGIGITIAEGARNRAPVRTGRLLDSIYSRVHIDGESVYVDVRAIFYDYFLEKPASNIGHARRILRGGMADVPKLL